MFLIRGFSEYSKRQRAQSKIVAQQFLNGPDISAFRVWDPEGKEYIDMLSAYSAVNQVSYQVSLSIDALLTLSTGSLSPKNFTNFDRTGAQSNAVVKSILFIASRSLCGKGYLNVWLRHGPADEHWNGSRRDGHQARTKVGIHQEGNSRGQVEGVEC